MSDILVNFVHITDTHLLMPGQTWDYSDISPDLENYARQTLAMPYQVTLAAESLIREINTLPLDVDFVLHTGDLAGQLRDGDDYRHMIDTLKRIKAPVYYVPGNHDEIHGMERVLRTADISLSSGYTFDCNGVQVVCLNTSHAGVSHAGWLLEEQLKWLEDICAVEDPRSLVVALHHHPLPIGVGWLDELGLLNGDVLHRVLLKARHRLRGVFHGHIHHSVDVIQDGILYSSASSAWCQFTGWPGYPQAALDLKADPGFNIVTLTHDKTYVRHHRYRVS